MRLHAPPVLLGGFVGAFGNLAGFGPDQALEVIAGLAVSIMANYAGNITNPIVEDPFEPQIWKP